MTTREEPWPPGTPCWVDVMVSDLARSQAFYADVLGWEFTESAPELGGYCQALVDGLPVAGLAPTMPGMESAPKVWTVYLATNDLVATNDRALAGGASPIAAAMQIADLGSMALWIDPNGASFGAWQSGSHTGYRITEVPGAVGWCDLMTSDLTTAQDFYRDVFGFEYLDAGLAGAESYLLFTVETGGQPVGGVGLADGQAAGWNVCFQSDDVDAAVDLIDRAGGQIIQQPWDFEFGRLLAAAGPDGEPFALITPAAAA